MKSRIKRLAFLAISGAIVFTFVYVAEAGLLSPVASPADTFYDLGEIYAPLIGSYDSSAIASSSDGSAIQIAKCIIEKSHGENC